MVGGLLGQWACWTERAVATLARIQEIHARRLPIPIDLLTLAGQLTLGNQAIFDADHRFKGCIPGISHVLQGQGLISANYSLDPDETLSPGQSEAIDRIISEYPHLTDDTFVRQNLDQWLSE